MFFLNLFSSRPSMAIKPLRHEGGGHGVKVTERTLVRRNAEKDNNGTVFSKTGDGDSILNF